MHLNTPQKNTQTEIENLELLESLLSRLRKRLVAYKRALCSAIDPNI